MKLDTDKMLADKDGATGWITFNNPERRNAMSLEMWSGLETALAAFEEDPEVRAIVMKGAGDKAFVSGADISQFAEKRADAEAAAAYARTSESARRKLSSVTKPLIGMIRGFCMGGGLGIAMKADVRIASADSIFGIPAARLSIAYSFDNVRDLVSLVGPSFAKDILFSARRLTADEALRIGLVNRVVPAEELEQTVRDYDERNVRQTEEVVALRIETQQARTERKNALDCMYYTYSQLVVSLLTTACVSVLVCTFYCRCSC
jgi:enoyl-CoA hydratase/carnithine racemase